MPVIGSTDIELYFESRGSGDPLVLIPGFASGAWSWSWQADQLAELFRVVTFDPRGVARSKMIDGGAVSIEGIANDIAAILDTLAIEKAHILGISFGGFVAQEFALHYPERLNKLVLASTSYGGPNHVAPSMEVLSSFASTEGMNTAERIRRYLTQAFSPEFVKSHSDIVESFCRLREENTVPEEVYLQQLQSAMTFNTEERVSEITAETLILSGDDDAVVPAQNSQNLAARLPNARLEILKDGGHMAFVERSGEFNRIVREFLIS